jgi:hypothetical protein
MMNNKIKGIAASKPTPFYRRRMSFNIKTIVCALLKAIAHIRSGQTDELASDAVDAMAGFGLSPSESNSAYLLITNSLYAATYNLARDSIDNLDLLYEIEVASLNNALASIVGSTKITLDHNLLTNPCALPVLSDIKPIYQQWLLSMGLSRQSALAASTKLDKYFVEALSSEWRENRASYDSLLAIVKTPFDPAEERERAWHNYFTTLHGNGNKSPMDSAFSTASVIGHGTDAQTAVAEYDIHSSRLRSQRRHLVHLEQHLAGWLTARKPEDSVMILSGVPRSGEPVFMKRLCTKLYEKGLAKPIYIPLHLIDIEGDIGDEINRFLRDGGLLSFDPLDPDFQINDLLLVFDGLEELTSDTAKRFILAIERMVERRNAARCALFVLVSESELATNLN